MSNELPKISIVTPSFNQGKYLEKTIQSVLDQDYPNLEYIIIDGGSTDNSVEIIKKYEKQLTYWVSEKDRGQSHAINKGFTRATGNIFGWLNSDDYYAPGSLKAVGEVALANPTAGAIVGAGDLVDEEGKSILHIEPFDVTVEALFAWIDKFFWQPSCFFTRDAWDQCGPLDEDLHYAMDLDLWFLIAKKYRFVTTPFLLSNSIKHASAKTTACETDTRIDLALVMMRHGGQIPARVSLSKYFDFIELKNSALFFEYERQMAQKDVELVEKEALLAEKNSQLIRCSADINAILNSCSWRLTSPLRWLQKKITGNMK